VKKLAVLLAVAALGYLAYTRLAPAPKSPEEGDFRRIARAYDAALSRYGQANRMTNVSGMDTTDDIGDIASTVGGLRKELADLEGRTEDDALLARIGALAARMDKFLSDKR
jgi:hypothetical protein